MLQKDVQYWFNGLSVEQRMKLEAEYDQYIGKGNKGDHLQIITQTGPASKSYRLSKKGIAFLNDKWDSNKKIQLPSISLQGQNWICPYCRGELKNHADLWDHMKQCLKNPANIHATPTVPNITLPATPPSIPPLPTPSTTYTPPAKKGPVKKPSTIVTNSNSKIPTSKSSPVGADEQLNGHDLQCVLRVTYDKVKNLYKTPKWECQIDVDDTDLTNKKVQLEMRFPDADGIDFREGIPYERIHTEGFYLEVEGDLQCGMCQIMENEDICRDVLTDNTLVCRPIPKEEAKAYTPKGSWSAGEIKAFEDCKEVRERYRTQPFSKKIFDEMDDKCRRVSSTAMQEWEKSLKKEEKKNG